MAYFPAQLGEHVPIVIIDYIGENLTGGTPRSWFHQHKEVLVKQRLSTCSRDDRGVLREEEQCSR